MSESWADLFADLRVASPPPPSGEEIMATLRRLSEPSMTAFVRPADAERVRRAVGDAWLGLAVRVVESEFVPDGEMVAIDHVGGNSGEPVTRRS